MSIQQALEGAWQKALTNNQKILNQKPNDINALNRLAKAHLELNQPALAKKNLQKILELDSTNRIALNNLTKLNKKNSNSNSQKPITSPIISFIEEPGKTQVLSLTTLAPKSTLTKLQTGQEVFLKSAARKIKLITSDKQYIGCIPDDLSRILSHRLKLGSKYQIFIRSATFDRIQIFIKETKQGKRLRNSPTFSTNQSGKIYMNQPQIIQPPLEIFDPDTESED